MCAAKSPISRLQEIAQAKYLPLPHYEILQHSTGFKCKATFGTLETSAIAESKKRAKIMCAERLLDLLRANSKTETIAYFEEDNNPLHVIIDVSQNDSVNYIGKLNELCSQKCQPYPDYKEMGVENMKFVFLCEHKSYITKGIASTKKQAKQLAAKEMLNRIGLSGFDKSHAAASAATAALDENMIRLVKELSVAYRKSDIPAKAFAQYNNCIFPMVQNEETSKNEVDFAETEEASDGESQPDEVTEQELKEELIRRGIKFSIEVFQKKPLVLVLKSAPTEKYPDFTFLSTGDSYEEAELVVLKTAVKNIRYIS